MDKFIFGCIDVHFGLTLIPTYQFRSPRRNFKALGKLDLVLLSLGGCNLVLNMYPCEYISNAMDGSEVGGFYIGQPVSHVGFHRMFNDANKRVHSVIIHSFDMS